MITFDEILMIVREVLTPHADLIERMQPIILCPFATTATCFATCPLHPFSNTTESWMTSTLHVFHQFTLIINHLLLSSHFPLSAFIDVSTLLPLCFQTGLSTSFTITIPLLPIFKQDPQQIHVATSPMLRQCHLGQICQASRLPS